MNLTLFSTETAIYDNKGAVASVRFNFRFFSEEYSAVLSKNNVEKDINFIEAEGSSDLFDAFVDQIENIYWQEMKLIFTNHETEENHYCSSKT